MTHPITPHKGGRTARAPEARIRPQTLQRIHAEMQERGMSFADLVEEQYGGNMDIVTAYNEDRTVHGNYKNLDTAIKALQDEGYSVVTRGDVTAIMERPAGENVFAHLLKPEYRAEAVTSAKRISIESSRISGL